MRLTKPVSMPGRLLLMVCGGLLPLWPMAGPAVGGSVKLTLVERQGVERRQEPVTTGVPVPKGELDSVDEVRLLRDATEIPAQFRAAGLWWPDQSIRWLLVDLQADLGANQRQEYTLQYGDGVRATARPAAPLRIGQDEEAYTVETGAATFRVSKKLFSLFEEVTLSDGTVIVPKRAGTGPQRGAMVRGLRATVTRAIPDPANRGRSYLIYVKCSEKVGLEDYTLRFTSDREYEVVGSKSGDVGHGAYRKDFVGRDGAVSIPADAWLQYAHPKKGDAYSFRTVPAGSSFPGEGVFQTSILERGPMRSVIRVKGSFGPAGAPVLEYTAWYHFYAGSGRVKLAITLENNDHGGRTPTGNARNADIGGVNCVFFDEMLLRLPLALEGNPRVCLGGSEDRSPWIGQLDHKAELYQDSCGGEHWNRYRDPKFHPRPNSYVTFQGYRVFQGDTQVEQGDRALGWMDVSDAAKGLTVAVQDFWQNFPKALSANMDGSIEVGLFPGRYAGDFPFRSGEHKTHEVLFCFHAGGPTKDGNKSVAKSFSQPLRLEPTPEWFAETRRSAACILSTRRTTRPTRSATARQLESSPTTCESTAS